ncbi:MAG: bi-domain-containing oxidoreductase [Candidatus Kapaibacterium sp.]
MLQVLQHQKSGNIEVVDLPVPECFPAGILVRNESSLISAGTERISVENTRSSLLERAKKQPEQVRQVLDFVKKEGIKSTYRRVMSVLESYKLLGYSSSGVVVKSDCDEFRPGDRVACAGAGYANHAEYAAIPKNLAAHIPENVTFDDASYTTLGAIAMQGFRQAEPELGENVAVIGLGLLGQITVQMLSAAGCNVAGIDINENLFPQAEKFGCEATYPSSFEHINNMLNFTSGMGFDSVIITASTPSNQPLELALEICRKKGRVVFTGAVGMNVPRGPFYKKEIDLRISSSYGPGRYDPEYEERGKDYPPAYVRWTENRNMVSFLKLISTGRMNVNDMTTHHFDAVNASGAYDIITGKKHEPFLGIILRYPQRQGDEKQSIELKPVKKDKINLGFIGAGQFAKNYLLPPLKSSKASFVSVSTATPVNAKVVAGQYGFSKAAVSYPEIINDPDTNVIFCATRHDTHAAIVEASINAGKPVYVEKPLCVSREQLNTINEALKLNPVPVMVGFNRRFSAPFKFIKEKISKCGGPFSMIYRVNAGAIPKSHWIHEESQGGRIIGEVCHFIDCMVYLTGELPVKVHAESVSGTNSEKPNYDDVAVTVKFSGGSLGTVNYYSSGGKSLGKEYFEIFGCGFTLVMDNFSKVSYFGTSGGQIKKFDGKKGINEEIAEVINALDAGSTMPIEFDEIAAVTLATFAATESLKSGEPVYL